MPRKHVANVAGIAGRRSPTSGLGPAILPKIALCWDGNQAHMAPGQTLL
eukprot:CAMPEP_0179332708 /NCGR_PEP_ID=MMETSP0797-20121207/64888_1 /TAXON_ID=47934 /ORGANISM="Dinophysis acuminata, Strain DAEP01" /LENGTH=48 /DNA_ID= /DNA_START= /DNA_END= /DNA_ORIENTATION=